MSAPEALLQAWGKTERGRAALVDGKLVAVWGIGRQGLFSTVGSPWMICSDDIYDKRVRRVFLRRSREEFSSLTVGFSRLHNFCHAENALTIRWLKWLGFEFPGWEYDLSGETFTAFTMEVT